MPSGVQFVQSIVPCRGHVFSGFLRLAHRAFQIADAALVSVFFDAFEPALPLPVCSGLCRLRLTIGHHAVSRRLFIDGCGSLISQFFCAGDIFRRASLELRQLSVFCFQQRIRGQYGLRIIAAGCRIDGFGS